MSAGVDYAFSSPDPVKLKAAGVDFAGRYLGAGTADKRLTHDEALSLNRAGIKCVSLVEGSRMDPLRGAPMGHDHALAAARDRTVLCVPAGRPFYFAVDWDVQLEQWAAVSAYLSGAAGIIGWGQVGVYGGLKAVTWAHDTLPVRWLFQTYAWSGGVWHPAAQLRQVHNDIQLAGGTVDLCQSTTVDYGQWTLTGPGRTEDMTTIVRCEENGGYYVYPQTKWLMTEGAVDAALHAYGLDRSAIVAFPTLDSVRDAMGIIPGLDAATDSHGNLPYAGVDQAAIQASAATGASAGVQGAIGSGSQLAQEVAAAVSEGLGTLSGSITLSGSLSGRVGQAS